MDLIGGAADRPAPTASPEAATTGRDPFEFRPLTLRLHRVLEGDRDAKGWIYETFAPRLYRRLRARYEGGPHGLDAEEILQDTFLSLFTRSDALERFLDRHSSEERTEARFEAFLWNHACGIASNRRRAQKRGAVFAFSEGEEPISGDADPERENLGRDLLARLSECLEARGRRTYLYFKLRFSDGLTPEEIALATGWSPKATYKLKLALNLAVAKCADMLGIE